MHPNVNQDWHILIEGFLLLCGWITIEFSLTSKNIFFLWRYFASLFAISIADEFDEGFTTVHVNGCGLTIPAIVLFILSYTNVSFAGSKNKWMAYNFFSPLFPEI